MTPQIVRAAGAFLLNPDAASPCKLCSCNEDGIRSEPVLFQQEPLSYCLRRYLPQKALDLAESVLIFKKTGHPPLSGGIWDQPASFVQAARAMGWTEERPSG